MSISDTSASTLKAQDMYTALLSVLIDQLPAAASSMPALQQMIFCYIDTYMWSWVRQVLKSESLVCIESKSAVGKSI